MATQTRLPTSQGGLTVQEAAERTGLSEAARELRTLLQEQEGALQERIRSMQGHLSYVRRKIDYWRALEAGKDAVARRIADELASQTHTKT